MDDLPRPSRDRPRMPDGYGMPGSTDGLLDWPDVEARLVAARQYWMATTRADARPHVVPRWGVWVAGRLWYDGAPSTVHARNLARNPACTLHLEDGWQAVIVEGTSRPAAPPGLDFGARLAEAFGDKYADRGYEPEAGAWGPDPWELLLATRPMHQASSYWGAGRAGLVLLGPAAPRTAARGSRSSTLVELLRLENVVGRAASVEQWRNPERLARVRVVGSSHDRVGAQARLMRTSSATADGLIRPDHGQQGGER